MQCQWFTSLKVEVYWLVRVKRMRAGYLAWTTDVRAAEIGNCYRNAIRSLQKRLFARWSLGSTVQKGKKKDTKIFVLFLKHMKNVLKRRTSILSDFTHTILVWNIFTLFKNISSPKTHSFRCIYLRQKMKIWFMLTSPLDKITVMSFSPDSPSYSECYSQHSPGQKTEHITPMLKTHHWLLKKGEIDFKILLTVYTVLNGLAPQYISLSIPPRTLNHQTLVSTLDPK